MHPIYGISLLVQSWVAPRPEHIARPLVTAHVQILFSESWGGVLWLEVPCVQPIVWSDHCCGPLAVCHHGMAVALQRTDLLTVEVDRLLISDSCQLAPFVGETVIKPAVP